MRPPAANPMAKGSRANDPLIAERVHLLSPEDQQTILEEAARRAGARNFFDSLESLVEDKEGFGLTTLSPLQRAICRLTQGVPLADLSTNEIVARSIGMSVTELRLFEAVRKKARWPKFREVMVIAGIRTFKSMFLAAAAVWATQTVDVSALSPGEIPRYSIVSLTVDNAKVVLMHLLGALKSPTLARIRIDEKALSDWSQWRDIIKESSADLVGSVFLWHPAGRPVEIRVVAGRRAGGSTVSRWSAGLGVDEAPRMVGASEGVINYDDLRRSVIGRLLPGAQVFSVGSPWSAVGPVYEQQRKSFGAPTPHLIIIKARGPDMNPYWWTEARCTALKEADPLTYLMDVEAEFAAAGEMLFTPALLGPCTREAPGGIPPSDGMDTAAAMDPATRGNAWTLVIVGRQRVLFKDGTTRSVKRVLLNMQWQGTASAPLRPKLVLLEIANLLREYNLDYVYSDQYAADAIKDLAHDMGLAVVDVNWTQTEMVKNYLGVRTQLEEQRLELPNDDQFQRDLRMVERIVNNRGPSIRLGTTADGRHCDYAPALVLALSPWLAEEEQARPAAGTPAARREELARRDEEAYAKATAKYKGARHWLEIDPFSNPDVIAKLGKLRRLS